MNLDDIEKRFNHKGSLVTFDAQQMRIDAALLIGAVRQLGAQSQGLWEHAQHIDDCPRHTGWPDESLCTCGFDALRGQVDADVLELLAN